MESYRKEIPAPPPNQASSESCANELTRSNSDSSSLSVANSKDTLLHSGNATTPSCSSFILKLRGTNRPNQESSKLKEDKYTGWTNEKHNTFLDRLEASFVKQLHRSIALRAGSVEMNQSCRNLSEELSAQVNKASEQLPFLYHGCWRKIKTVRKPPVVYSTADSHDCQFCYSDKGKRTRDEKPTNGHKTRSHLILSKPGKLQKTVCRLTEGSGQNFMVEDFDENLRCKKMKTASVDTTDQEQIVPTMNMGVQELLVPCSGEITK